MRSEIEMVRSTDGTTIAFDRLASGPPLILVGGGGAAMAGEPLDPAEWAGVGAPTLVLAGFFGGAGDAPLPDGAARERFKAA